MSHFARITCLLFALHSLSSKCHREYNSENSQVYAGNISVDIRNYAYLVHFSNSHNEFLVHLSGNPLQGNIIDYFSFINPDILGKNPDQYVVKNSAYLNSPLDSDYVVKKEDFLDKKTFDEINSDDSIQKFKFVDFFSEEDYLERYNILFIDGLLGGGFYEQSFNDP